MSATVVYVGYYVGYSLCPAIGPTLWSNLLFFLKYIFHRNVTCGTILSAIGTAIYTCIMALCFCGLLIDRRITLDYIRLGLHVDRAHLAKF